MSALSFLRDGYVVFPTFSKGDLRAELEAEFKAMPEFTQHPSFAECDKDTKYTCGATAFCGNPSVYHNLTSRRMRREMAEGLAPFFQEVALQLGRPELKIAGRAGRIQVRGAGCVPSKESAHRDVNATYRPGEIWLGGWTNLDRTPQVFDGVIGTHTLDVPAAKGFSKIPKGDRPKYAAMLLEQAGRGTTETGGILVPPGHFILFFQNMVHYVNAKKSPTTSVKQFHGFRLTDYDDSGFVDLTPDARLVVPKKRKMYTFDELEAKMKANACMPMGSQVPVMYPANYLVCRDKQLPIFERFQAAMLLEGSMNIPLRDHHGKIQHKTKVDWTRSMKSLADLGLPLHPTYTLEELDFMRPKKICKA